MAEEMDWRQDTPPEPVTWAPAGQDYDHVTPTTSITFPGPSQDVGYLPDASPQDAPVTGTGWEVASESGYPSQGPLATPIIDPSRPLAMATPSQPDGSGLWHSGPLQYREGPFSTLPGNPSFSRSGRNPLNPCYRERVFDPTKFYGHGVNKAPRKSGGLFKRLQQAASPAGALRATRPEDLSSAQQALLGRAVVASRDAGARGPAKRQAGDGQHSENLRAVAENRRRERRRASAQRRKNGGPSSPVLAVPGSWPDSDAMEVELETPVRPGSTFGLDYPATSSTAATSTASTSTGPRSSSRRRALRRQPPGAWPGSPIPFSLERKRRREETDAETDQVRNRPLPPRQERIGPDFVAAAERMANVTVKLVGCSAIASSNAIKRSFTAARRHLIGPFLRQVRYNAGQFGVQTAAGANHIKRVCIDCVRPVYSLLAGPRSPGERRQLQRRAAASEARRSASVSSETAVAPTPSPDARGTTQAVQPAQSTEGAHATQDNQSSTHSASADHGNAESSTTRADGETAESAPQQSAAPGVGKAPNEQPVSILKYIGTDPPKKEVQQKAEPARQMTVIPRQEEKESVFLGKPLARVGPLTGAEVKRLFGKGKKPIRDASSGASAEENRFSPPQSDDDVFSPVSRESGRSQRSSSVMSAIFGDGYDSTPIFRDGPQWSLRPDELEDDHDDDDDSSDEDYEPPSDDDNDDDSDDSDGVCEDDTQTSLADLVAELATDEHLGSPSQLEQADLGSVEHQVGPVSTPGSGFAPGVDSSVDGPQVQQDSQSAARVDLADESPTVERAQDPAVPDDLASSVTLPELGSPALSLAEADGSSSTLSELDSQTVLDMNTSLYREMFGRQSTANVSPVKKSNLRQPNLSMFTVKKTVSFNLPAQPVESSSSTGQHTSASEPDMAYRDPVVDDMWDVSDDESDSDMSEVSSVILPELDHDAGDDAHAEVAREPLTQSVSSAQSDDDGTKLFAHSTSSNVDMSASMAAELLGEKSVHGAAPFEGQTTQADMTASRRAEEREKELTVLAEMTAKLHLFSPSSSSRRAQIEAEEEAERQAEIIRKRLAAKAKAEAEERERQEREEQARKEREEAERQAELARQNRRRIPLEKVIQPLSKQWEAKVDAVMRAAAGKQVATMSNGQGLTRRDFDSLVPRQRPSTRASSSVAAAAETAPWLNDEIINAYLAAIVDYGFETANQASANAENESSVAGPSRAPAAGATAAAASTTTTTTTRSLRSQAKGAVPRFHAFNSFFYSKLRDQGPSSVARWAEKVNIGGANLLRCERVFIPVHQHAHWTLLVVSPAQRTIEYFDSLGGAPGPFVRNARVWIQATLPAGMYVESEWRVPNDSVSPVQRNGFDCGVFAITTAKMIALGLDPRAYDQADIPLQRRRIAAELINGGFKGDFAPPLFP